MFGLNNQLGGANKAVGVADMANELDKLDGADKANVIVKIVLVDEAGVANTAAKTAQI